MTTTLLNVLGGKKTPINLEELRLQITYLSGFLCCVINGMRTELHRRYQNAIGWSSGYNGLGYNGHSVLTGSVVTGSVEIYSIATGRRR